MARFESLGTRLQACIDPLERSNRQRPALLEQLEQSRVFYSEQYREVHVVMQVSRFLLLYPYMYYSIYKKFPISHSKENFLF